MLVYRQSLASKRWQGFGATLKFFLWSSGINSGREEQTYTANNNESSQLVVQPNEKQTFLIQITCEGIYFDFLFRDDETKGWALNYFIMKCHVQEWIGQPVKLVINNEGENDYDCTICLERLIDGVSFNLRLPCGREFRQSCIRQWREDSQVGGHTHRQNRPVPCPICRTKSDFENWASSVGCKTLSKVINPTGLGSSFVLRGNFGRSQT